MATSKKSTSKKKTYLAVFLGTASSGKKWEKLPPKVRREREAAGMQAWGEWIAKNKASIIEMGAPLGATRRIDRRGLKKVRNDMTAYTVVRASSHDAAAKMFEGHPHFTIFPGDSVEVMECLDIPGM